MANGRRAWRWVADQPVEAAAASGDVRLLRSIV